MPVGATLPCAGSSVTTIERTSSSEGGIATFAHARPYPSARKVAPLTAGAALRTAVAFLRSDLVPTTAHDRRS